MEATSSMREIVFEDGGSTVSMYINQPNLLRGEQLLMRRETIVPNIKNFKNLKYFSNIRAHYEIKKELGKGKYG